MVNNISEYFFLNYSANYCYSQPCRAIRPIAECLGDKKRPNKLIHNKSREQV